jgi:hypothetical protein
LIVLTTEERLIWRCLRDQARAGAIIDPEASCIHYGTLGKQVDPDDAWRYPMSRPPFRGFNDALGHVSQYEHEHGRPLLSSLVTTVDDGQPGTGFALFVKSLGLAVDGPEAFWRAEVKKTVYFWSTADQILLLDAAADRIIATLANSV